MSPDVENENEPSEDVFVVRIRAGVDESLNVTMPMTGFPDADTPDTAFPVALGAGADPELDPQPTTTKSVNININEQPKSFLIFPSLDIPYQCACNEEQGHRNLLFPSVIERLAHGQILEENHEN